MIVSMDDYFHDYKDSPVDENGNRNFDSINHLDVELLEFNITDPSDLIYKKGREVLLHFLKQNKLL